MHIFSDLTAAYTLKTGSYSQSGINDSVFLRNDLGTALGTDGGLVVECGRGRGTLGATPLSVFCIGN